MSDCLPKKVPKKTSSCLVVAADGCEELEFFTPIDIMRRAGVQVHVANLVADEPIVLAQGTKVKPCGDLAKFKGQEFDAVVIPGGMDAAELMCECMCLGEILEAQASAKKVIAAICSAPLVLAAHDIKNGACLTAYPTLKSRFEESYVFEAKQKLVVEDNLITGQGPGVLFEFSFKIVEFIVDGPKAEAIAKDLLLSYKCEETLKREAAEAKKKKGGKKGKGKKGKK